MPVCNVCGATFGAPIYSSARDRSLTSLCELRPGQTHVFFCETCGHLQTPSLPDLAAYYESEYRISLDSDDEDQLYKVVAGRPIFRVEHQVATLLRKVSLPANARVLDYGCAKGAAARKLQAARADVALHLFDVSEMYLPFWERFVTGATWATHELPAAWNGQLDLAMSFYVLEHVPEPVAALRQLAALLKPSGLLYWLVPNVFANPADFIVADHINHFSPASAIETVRRAGLHLVEVDTQSHEAGLIVVASNAERPAEQSVLEHRADELENLRRESQQLASNWTNLGQRIATWESPHGSPAAIYGSGFYGSFIASCLPSLDGVACFVDQSPFRQGKQLFGKPIVAPRDLPPDVAAVYVGLNPHSAKQAIAQIDDWRSRRLDFFYL